jgi:hypothetical protein
MRNQNSNGYDDSIATDLGVSDKWVIKCWGTKTREWRPWLSENGYRWHSKGTCWVAANLEEDQAEFMMGILRATVKDQFTYESRLGDFEAKIRSPRVAKEELKTARTIALTIQRMRVKHAGDLQIMRDKLVKALQEKRAVIRQLVGAKKQIEDLKNAPEGAAESPIMDAEQIEALVQERAEQLLQDKIASMGISELAKLANLQ